MHTTIKHHGVTFSIDTADWSDSNSRQICEDSLIEGIQSLTEDQVKMIAHAWRHPIAEEASLNNPRCPASRIINKIQANARSAGTKGWAYQPDSGHNAHISIDYKLWSLVNNFTSVYLGVFEGVDEIAAIDHMACNAGFENLAEMKEIKGVSPSYLVMQNMKDWAKWVKVQA